jgi:hypothetical protein
MIEVKGMSNKRASQLGMATKVSPSVLCNSFPSLLRVQCAYSCLHIPQSGGSVGAIVFGYLSQYIGRRRSLMTCSMMMLVLLPAYILPNTFSGLAAGGWFFDAFLDGIHGTLPIHLNELATPAFRALLPGTAFQIGEMVSSPSSQLVNTIAEAHHVNNHGKQVEAYGPVTLGFIAICAAILVVCSSFGPERRGSHFEVAAAAGTVPLDDQSEEEDKKEKEESTRESKLGRDVI